MMAHELPPSTSSSSNAYHLIREDVAMDTDDRQEQPMDIETASEMPVEEQIQMSFFMPLAWPPFGIMMEPEMESFPQNGTVSF